MADSQGNTPFSSGSTGKPPSENEANDGNKQKANKDAIAEWIQKLKQQRDEIALQLHLAEMDAKDEFVKAKEKLDRLSQDYEPLKEAVAESAEGIWESLKLVAGEVKSSFDRIRKSL